MMSTKKYGNDLQIKKHHDFPQIEFYTCTVHLCKVHFSRNEMKHKSATSEQKNLHTVLSGNSHAYIS